MDTNEVEMGIMKWLSKGVDVEKPEEEQTRQENVVQEQEEVMRRRKAYLQLTNGQANDTLSTQTANTKKTVNIYQIKSNEDISTIVDVLNAGEPVIINLSKISKNEIQRTLDFISGVIFVLKAHTSMIANNMYLITPQGVKIAN